MPLVVYKLGGSLLDLPDWPARLREYWSNRPADERRLLVVGGGPATDLVRQWDRLYDLGEKISHFLAVKSLALTESLASILLPECRIVANADQVNSLPSGACGIIHVRDFLTHSTAAREIPERWDFTTDSIAAYIAEILQAQKLVLLKSTTPAGAADLDDLIAQGVVDREFAGWSRQIPHIEIVNFRQVDRAHSEAGFARVQIENRSIDSL